MQEVKDLPTEIHYLSPEDFIEHECCGLVQLMTEEKWGDFLESVKESEMIEMPVCSLPDNRIIDGRHRLRAAKQLGLKQIPVVYYDITEEEAVDMIEKGIIRRNLRREQELASKLKFEKYRIEKLGIEAKNRQYEAGKYGSLGGRGNKKTLDSDLNQGFKKTRRVHEQLAEEAEVGSTTMYYLMTVQENAPDLFEEVWKGNMKPDKAYKLKKLREEAPDLYKKVEDKEMTYNEAYKEMKRVKELKELKEKAKNFTKEEEKDNSTEVVFKEGVVDNQQKQQEDEQELEHKPKNKVTGFKRGFPKVDKVELEEKLDSLTASEIKENEEENPFSPNNLMIYKRDDLEKAMLSFLKAPEIIENQEVGQEYKDSYYEKAIELLKTGLLFFGQLSKKEDQKELIETVIKLIEKIKIEEDELL